MFNVLSYADLLFCFGQSTLPHGGGADGGGFTGTDAGLPGKGEGS